MQSTIMGDAYFWSATPYAPAESIGPYAPDVGCKRSPSAFQKQRQQRGRNIATEKVRTRIKAATAPPRMCFSLVKVKLG